MSTIRKSRAVRWEITSIQCHYIKLHTKSLSPYELTQRRSSFCQIIFTRELTFLSCHVRVKLFGPAFDTVVGSQVFTCRTTPPAWIHVKTTSSARKLKWSGNWWLQTEGASIIVKCACKLQLATTLQGIRSKFFTIYMQFIFLKNFRLFVIIVFYCTISTNSVRNK